LDALERLTKVSLVGSGYDPRRRVELLAKTDRSRRDGLLLPKCDILGCWVLAHLVLLSMSSLGMSIALRRHRSGAA